MVIGCAEECRRAALEFMAGVAAGWDKLDLAVWLNGPYALASGYAPRGVRAGRSGEHAIGADVPPRIEEPAIEHLLVSVRGQILAGLELAALDHGTPDFIEDALIAQHVRRVDVGGEMGWVPVDITRMRLKDRVASLFVADYLNRPDDYRNLFVCHLCESITFDGRCGQHRLSGTVPKVVEPAKRFRTTLSWGH
jgi:hypothetical protein